jgi:hypothetical protein
MKKGPEESFPGPVIPLGLVRLTASRMEMQDDPYHGQWCDRLFSSEAIRRNEPVTVRVQFKHLAKTPFALCNQQFEFPFRPSSPLQQHWKTFDGTVRPQVISLFAGLGRHDHHSHPFGKADHRHPHRRNRRPRLTHPCHPRRHRGWHCRTGQRCGR